MIINNGSSDSPAPYSPTTIDLIDDDDDDTPSPTSSISEPPQKLSRLDNCVPASNSCINNNDKLPFSTSFHQETRQSSQVVTVATRYGPHGIETMSHMASAHIVHRYPVTTTLITNKASTRHYTSNCLSMTRIGSHQSSLRHFTSINNNNNNPPTIVKIIRTDFPVPPNSSPLSSTNPMSNAIVPVTVSNTCENETIELD
ncbi:unnamed protein product [Heterobilharzia americana]|nr:unnamed protein product [Heterobilharzia americana]